MNAAHDLDRPHNDTIVVIGRNWIICSKFSTGRAESIVKVLLPAWQSRGLSTVSVAGDKVPSIVRMIKLAVALIVQASTKGRNRHGPYPAGPAKPDLPCQYELPDYEDHLMSLTTITVLGKRKSRVTSETLLLQLSASDSNNEHSDVSWQELEPDSELSRVPLSSRKKIGSALVNGSLVKNAKKKYHCTFSGCGKSYSKPCRLEEHERSHTGEVGAFALNFCIRSKAFT